MTPGIVLPDFLEVAARQQPARLALSFGKRRWTFAELEQAAAAAARFLGPALAEAATGRLGILSSNRPGVAIAVHAAARGGVSFVPLNWRQTERELGWQIETANITVVIVDEVHRILAERAIGGRQVSLLPIADLEDPEEVGRAVDSAPAIALDREAAVLFTSGTGGRPKGARLTYGNLWYSAVSSAITLGQEERDTWLAALSLFHIGGLSILYRGVIGRTHVALHERFDPAAALEEIDRGASLVSLVPTMLRRMVDDRGPGPWPNTLRTVLLGGGPAPVELIQESLERGIPVAPTYGLTESASQATTLLPGDAINRIGSSGLPLPATRLRIAEQGQGLGPLQTGEIELLGPTLFRGYLGEGERDMGSGWFATGDAGYLDGDGYLYVIDRRSDLIISGGENVYPAEIERVLLEHPLVSDAGVIGVPETEWGARPVAAVVWQGDPALAVEALRSHCRQRLASYKVPDRFCPVPSLPRSASGKLLRRDLGAVIGSAGGDTG